MANLGVHLAHYQLLIKLFPKKRNLAKNMETPGQNIAKLTSACQFKVLVFNPEKAKGPPKGFLQSGICLI